MRFWLFMEWLLLFSRAAEAAGAFTVSLIVHGDTERQENTLCKAVACGNREGLALVIIAGHLNENVSFIFSLKVVAVDNANRIVKLQTVPLRAEW